MTVIELGARTIRLEAACDYTECAELAFPLHNQLSRGYTRGASILRLPDMIEQWEADHRTARKRANACARNGYVFGYVEPGPRYVDDIFAVNTSMRERQGRPMSEGYLARPTVAELDYRCRRHEIVRYGVFKEGHLVAYSWVYRVGGLVMFSTILGHADHLERHVMYLLVRGVLKDQIKAGPGVAFYNLHDSGTDGLRFFKERCGFHPAEVEWAL